MRHAVLFKMLFKVAAVVLGSIGSLAHAAPFIPNDPFYANNQWYAARTGLDEAWSISHGSPGVIAAVLDTGVMRDTPDLQGRLLEPLSATGGPPLSGMEHHHGTWIASVLGMNINNFQGGAGVGAFSILPITITNASGHNSSDWIAEGIRLAADNGARVINISHSTLQYGKLDQAAQYALSKGALVFVAAGNSNTRNSDASLANLEHLIFVTGTGRNDERWVQSAAVGSTWGPFIDLSAPSDDILIADPLDPSLPNGYGVIDGTSFAAPLAAGAAALAWSINPELSPLEVRQMLYNTAVDLGEGGWDEVYGHGRINFAGVASAALASVPEPGGMSCLMILTPLLLRRRA